MKILVTLKHVYGTLIAYPANDGAQLLADVAGAKSLSVRVVRTAIKYGASVQADASAADRIAFEKLVGEKIL